MKKTLAGLAGAAAMLVTLTACGNGDDDAAVKALTASFTENSADSPVTKKEATCFAQGIVDELGVDKLKEYKILTDDLKATSGVNDIKMSEGDADKAATEFVDCVDVDAMFTKLFSQGGELTEAQSTCISDALDEDSMKSLMSKTFQGKSDEASQALIEPVTKCLTS